jgi:two-component system, cell cycle response regulator DivK
MSLPNLENKNVLVVEDDDLSFLYLNQLFLLTKCHILRAKSGAEALAVYEKTNPDLILMDIQLPDMKGTEVTAKIRLLDHHVPVIAQTAGKTFEEQESALEAGCSAVLVKPFTMEQLFEVIGKYL